MAADNEITTGQTGLYSATGSNGAAVTQQSYKGSIVAGKNTGTVIDLSLEDAIGRGLRQNLGILLQGSAIRSANGQRSGAAAAAAADGFGRGLDRGGAGLPGRLWT